MLTAEEDEEQEWNIRDSTSTNKMNGRSYEFEFPKTFEGFGYKFNQCKFFLTVYMFLGI